MRERQGPSVTIREPLTSPAMSITNGSYRWVSRGALGDIFHVTIAPQNLDDALSFCGVIVEVNVIQRAVDPRLACSRCLDELRKAEAEAR